MPREIDDQAYDRLLLRLESFGSGLSSGFTSHAPMVVDALFSLGRGEAAGGWLDAYLAGALPRPAPAAMVQESGWQDALGVAEFESAWAARFEADIAEFGWRHALSLWVGRLAPGFAAAAAHGVIRTAHAARALARADTVPRRAELAAALALWASSWQVLPGDPLGRSGALGATAALREIPLVPRDQRRNGGAITTALTVLAGHPGFGAALARLDRSVPLDELALDLATAFAAEFLRQVHSATSAIVFTHSITGIAATRRLAPLVGDAVARSLVAHAWQTGAALHACYAKPDAVESRPETSEVEALIDATVDHGDEHVIKLTEACVEFHWATGDSRFLLAATRAMAVLPPA